jgi:hypothetical protein
MVFEVLLNPNEIKVKDWLFTLMNNLGIIAIKYIGNFNH